MISLEQTLKRLEAGSTITPTTDWHQGRTIYGGLTAALALQAALNEYGAQLPPLKSAQFTFIAPATHELTFAPQLLRQGKSTTVISVDCLVESEVVLRALFVFASHRPSQIEHDFVTPPWIPPHQKCALLEHINAPASLNNFLIRPAGGSLPVSGAEHPMILAWVKHIDSVALVNPTVALLALADSLPPAAMACFTDFAPVSTMTWSIDFVQPTPTNEWFLLRSTSQYAKQGYSYQTMEIWDDEGNLVLLGNQTVTIFT